MTEKLDKFQKRFGPKNVSSGSPSSSVPSNIIYHTPSGTSRPPSNTGQAVRQSNDSVESDFENIEGSELNHQTEPPLSFVYGANARLPKDFVGLFKLGYEHAHDSNYRAAEQIFKLLRLRLVKENRLNHIRIVMVELSGSLMRLADFPGCPQSIITRFAQELSTFLIRERQRYNQATPGKRSITVLCKTLVYLKRIAEWSSLLVTQQRALQIWAPILGPEHSKIRMMCDSINRMKHDENVDLRKHTWRIAGAENMAPETFELISSQHLKPIGNLLHLCDGSPDDLLRNFHLLEDSDILSQQFQQDIQHLQYGRSKSLFGCYHSLLQRYDDAEKAFKESERYMQYEGCVEIQLHRILWYAEHKTRVQDDEGVRKLLCQAHEIFMSNDNPLEFILAHFTNRFSYLCLASSRRVPIDEVLNETLDGSAFGCHPSLSLPPSTPQVIADTPRSVPASPIPSPERLFPMTPRGINSAIDIETWRQFITFPYQGQTRKMPQPKPFVVIIDTNVTFIP